MKFVLYIQKIKEKSTEICPPPAPQITLNYVGLCAKRSAKGYNFKEDDIALPLYITLWSNLSALERLSLDSDRRSSSSG